MRDPYAAETHDFINAIRRRTGRPEILRDDPALEAQLAGEHSKPRATGDEDDPFLEFNLEAE